MRELASACTYHPPFPCPQDLCERHERGVLHKHQRALHKYGLMRRQMLSAAAQSREPQAVEQLESRMVEVQGCPLFCWLRVGEEHGTPCGAGLENECQRLSL